MKRTRFEKSTSHLNATSTSGLILLVLFGITLVTCVGEVPKRKDLASRIPTSIEAFDSLRSQALKEAVHSADEEKASDLRRLWQEWQEDSLPTHFWQQVFQQANPLSIALSLEQGTPYERSYRCRAILETDSGGLLIKSRNSSLLVLRKLDGDQYSMILEQLLTGYNIDSVLTDLGPVVDDPNIGLLYWGFGSDCRAVVIYSSGNTTDRYLSGVLWYIDSIFND